MSLFFNTFFIYSNASVNEHFETHVSEILPDEEIQLHEELQILLPPRCDDTVGETSKSN